MARKRATLTDLLNDLTAKLLYDKYKLLACSAFEWSGLPDGILERHIETYLFKHGKAIFFKDPDMSYMCLEAQNGNGINVYGDPLSYIATGFNYHRTFKADNCVIIENNPLRINTDDFILFYVNKLTEAERTMDVNVKSVKTPVIFTCDDKDVLTFKRLFQMIDGNTPAIFADKNLNVDSIQAFKTGATFLCNDIMDYKKAVEGELMTFLGFNNTPVDKKERVNLSEANSNNEIIESFSKLQLEARQNACKAINEMYGLNVSVKRREVEADVESNPLRNKQIDAGIA